jgi:hypothetical protein
MRPTGNVTRQAAHWAVLGFGMAVAAAPIAWALPHPSPIQQQTAAAVVRDLQIEGESSDLEPRLQVLAPFTALPAGASIHVVSARAAFVRGSWLLRLDCDSRRDCLPFDAVLRLPEAAGRMLEKKNLGTRTVHAPQMPLSGRQRVTPLARRGDRVELVEESGGVRMRTGAVCLDSGALGDRIRVQNRMTHRIVLATVAGENLARVLP